MSDVQSSLSYVATMCATVDIDHNSCDIKYEKKSFQIPNMSKF